MTARIRLVLLIAALVASCFETASAQQPRTFVDTLDPAHRLVRKYFRDDLDYRRFRFQLGRLREMLSASVIVIAVPSARPGESIARIFHESFAKTAADVAALRPEFERTNVLMIALSEKPSMFALDGRGSVKDRLVLSGTIYSATLRSLQLRAIVTPADALSELPPVLAEELKAPSKAMPPFFEQQAIEAVEGSFYGIALPHTFERWLFIGAQAVILWLQSAYALSGWLLFGVFCAAICVARILTMPLTKFVEKFGHGYSEKFLDMSGADSKQVRSFIVRKLFERVLEFAFVLTFMKFLMTVAFGDLLSILTISQLSHHDFGQLFSVAQRTATLSSTPPSWLVLAAVAVSLVGIAILLLELAAAFRLSLKFWRLRRRLVALAIAVLAVLVAWLVFPLIGRLPVLLVLKGSVAWVVIGTVATWSLFELWDVRDALARRRASGEKQAAA